MCYKIVSVFLLIVALAQTRQIEIRNIGKDNLTVSVSGQDDVLLLRKTNTVINVEEGWSGKISAVREHCDNECEGPRTTAELSLNTLDTYDVSLVEGFNIPIKIVPVERKTNCRAAVCEARINEFCPIENQIVNNLGEVVACKNSPLIFSKVCPRAVVVEGDTTNVLTCQAQSYLVLLN